MLSGKVILDARSIIRDKGECFTLKKMATYQNNIKILNLFAPQFIAFKKHYKKH